MAEPNEHEIATILESLRAEVRALRVAQGEGETGTALSAIERELHHAAEQLEITRVVSAHWPLEGGSLYEQSWALVHKVVRRSLSWYIPPIVEQQNAFNAAAARALRLLAEAHAELRDQTAELRRQLGEDAPPLPSDDVPAAPLPRLGEAARELNERKDVSAHFELGGPPPAALVQRTVRQYLRWMVNPIVEQQNSFNNALAAAATPLVAVDGELRTRVAALRAAVARRGAGH